MRAALYNGKTSIEMTELPTPDAGENDIVVKNIYASICGTDVAVYEHGPGTGHRITVGSEFGHEMVSEVFQVGKNVKNIKVGDRVYPYPRLAKGDLKRAGTTGGFSEYILIPNAELGKGVYAIHQSGRWYTNENIDQMLMERHLNGKARRGSHKNHIKGPKKRTKDDDERFAQFFEKMVQMAINKNEAKDDEHSKANY